MRFFVTKMDEIRLGHIRIQRGRKVLNPAIIRLLGAAAIVVAAAWLALGG